MPKKITTGALPEPDTERTRQIHRQKKKIHAQQRLQQITFGTSQAPIEVRRENHSLAANTSDYDDPNQLPLSRSEKGHGELVIRLK